MRVSREIGEDSQSGSDVLPDISETLFDGMRGVVLEDVRTAVDDQISRRDLRRAGRVGKLPLPHAVFAALSMENVATEKRWVALGGGSLEV